MGSTARAGWCWRRGRGWRTAPPTINDGGAPAGGAVNGAAGGVVDDVIGSVGSVGAQRRCAPTNPTTDRCRGQIRRRQYNMRIASNPAGPR